MDIPVLVGSSLLCALIAAAIGSAKRRAGFGFFLGLVLGPVGVIVIALLPGEKRRDYMDALASRPSPTPPSAADATQALLDLKKLLDAGAITQAEFDGKKKILLDRVGRPAATVRAPSSVQYRIPGVND